MPFAAGWRALLIDASTSAKTELHMLTLAALAAVTLLSPHTSQTVPGRRIAPEAGAVGTAAPAFSLASPAGKKYSLGDYRGMWIVLEWTNRDCPFVKKHYSTMNMQKTQAAALAKGAVWFSICSSAAGKQGNLAPSEHMTNQVAVQSNATALLLDESGKVGKSYGAKTTPQIVIINKVGKIVYNGAVDDQPTPDIRSVRVAKNFVLRALDQAMADKKIESASALPYGCPVKYADGA